MTLNLILQNHFGIQYKAYACGASHIQIVLKTFKLVFFFLTLPSTYVSVCMHMRTRAHTHTAGDLSFQIIIGGLSLVEKEG